MEETISGNAVTDTPVEETQDEVTQNENTETEPETTPEDISEVTPEDNYSDIQDNPDNSTPENTDDLSTKEDGSLLLEELGGTDTVSGSDVRTDTDITTEYVDYTELLTSVDAHLETIETTIIEQTDGLMSKPFDKYTVSESFSLMLLVVAVAVVLYQLLFGK